MPTPAAPPSLDQRLAFLRACVSPADGGGSARVVETHLSWVVLGPERVLKMKKPDGHPVVDLASVEARERNARAELRLNRRLAPEVYLGVLALRWRDGVLALDADADEAGEPAEAARAGGLTLDWLVHMRRLPADRMLDRLVAGRRVGAADVDALAATLARFHAAARRVALSGTDYLARLRGEQRANRAVLEDARVGLGDAAATIDRFGDALLLHERRLARRAGDGRLVEGHGDLRPEHVCLLDRPLVIDCLEFDATLREVDPFDELAFLGLEAGLLGAGWIGHRLWHRCAGLLRDPADERLRLLYTARRALLRARLAAAHVLDAGVREPAAWRGRARRYLVLARRATGRVLKAR